MKDLRPLFILLLLIFGYFEFNYGKISEKADDTYGFINIEVESNINKVLFKYDFNERHFHTRKIINIGFDNDADISRLKIPLKDFQCSNPWIYKDFLSLLKADQYPHLEIYFPHKPENISVTNKYFKLNDVKITVAGISKYYDILCNIEDRDERGSFLIGNVRINLTDLEIEPPVKFSGIIKVKDEIIVKFGIWIRYTEEQIKI